MVQVWHEEQENHCNDDNAQSASSSYSSAVFRGFIGCLCKGNLNDNLNRVNNQTSLEWTYFSLTDYEYGWLVYNIVE